MLAKTADWPQRTGQVGEVHAQRVLEHRLQMFATRVSYSTECGPVITNFGFMKLYLPRIAICNIKSRFSGEKIHGCKPKTASTKARLCIKTPEENTASWMLSFHWLHTEKTKKNYLSYIGLRFWGILALIIDTKTEYVNVNKWDFAPLYQMRIYIF